MLKDLFVFDKERTGKEAFGFYLAYLLFWVLSGGLIVMLSGWHVAFVVVPDNPSVSVSFAEGFQEGTYWGVAVIFSLAISFAVLFKKEKLQDLGLVSIALLSGVGAMFLGGFLGLIPTAYLTTIKADKEERKNSNLDDDSQRGG